MQLSTARPFPLAGSTWGKRGRPRRVPAHRTEDEVPAVRPAHGSEPPHIVTFNDPQLQRCYASKLGEAGDASGDLRQVRALVATHELFRMLEGSHSARVHEVIEHLLSAQMRPALRLWFQRPGADADSAASGFRDQLSSLADERLENPSAAPDNPS
jgi:hypothetical protein